MFSFKLPQERCDVVSLDQLPLIASRLHPLAQRIMVKRNVDSIQYFNTDFTPYNNTLHLHDAERALSVIREHIAANNSICVYGDYDVDGITATSIMVSGLLEISSHLKSQPAISWYVPSRIDEGYGLSRDALKTLFESGVNLIITVDCGVSAVEEVAYARSLGLDVVITDHHTCLPDLPDANAVVNPRIFFDDYTGLDEICGAAVAFKLLLLYSKLYNFTFSRFCDYGGMAAVATVADVMKLEAENRLLVSAFLKPGMNLFFDTLSMALKKTVGKPVDVSFSIAPHINSVGRIGTSEQLDSLIAALVYPDALNTEAVVAMCLELNVSRRELTKSAIDEAVQSAHINSVIVTRGQWHQGIVGIIAGNLAEKYSRPAFVFTELQSDDDCLVCSARSFGDLNIYEKISPYADRFEHFGGHAQALGLTIKKENFEWFLQTVMTLFDFESVVNIKAIEYDLRVSPKDITSNFVSDLERLAPFGYGNLEPVFLFENVYPTNVKIMKDVHAKFKAIVDGTVCPIEFLMFNAMNTELCALLGGGVNTSVNLYGTVSFNVNPYNGVKNIQCLVQHYSISTENTPLCDRALFEKYFKYFRNHKIVAENQIPPELELPGAVSLILSVFVELGYLKVEGDTYIYQEPLGKKLLSESNAYTVVLGA